VRFNYLFTERIDIVFIGAYDSGMMLEIRQVRYGWRLAGSMVASGTRRRTYRLRPSGVVYGDSR